tara:strand:+ start:2813 stop:3271 length:459 start_codon:yes stop_codon:yes gene_type:complete
VEAGAKAMKNSKLLFNLIVTLLITGCGGSTIVKVRNNTGATLTQVQVRSSNGSAALSFGDIPAGEVSGEQEWNIDGSTPVSINSNEIASQTQSTSIWGYNTANNFLLGISVGNLADGLTNTVVVTNPYAQTSGTTSSVTTYSAYIETDAQNN